MLKKEYRNPKKYMTMVIMINSHLPNDYDSLKSKPLLSLFSTRLRKERVYNVTEEHHWSEDIYLSLSPSHYAFN